MFFQSVGVFHGYRLTRFQFGVDLIVRFIIFTAQEHAETPAIVRSAETGVMIIEVQQIPDFKCFIGPRNMNAMAFCELKRSIKFLSREAITVKNTPNLIEGLSILNRLLFSYDCVLDKAVRVHPGSYRKNFDASCV